MITNPLYWTWGSELPGVICDAIISEGLKLEHREALVGSGEERQDESIRRSTVGFFTNSQWLNSICWHYMARANSQAWNFDISGQQDPQFTIYEPNQFYGTHEDSSVCEDNMRKLSLVISLTEPQEYQGGEFEFADGTKPDIKARGSILVFPSFLQHKVNPVVRGKRFSLVNWFTGSKFR